MRNYNTDAISEMCSDPVDAARIGLYALMTGLSEEIWAAGWLHETEYALWSIVGGDDVDGWPLTGSQRELLRLLYEMGGGWWAVTKDYEITFVNGQQWEEHVATRAASQSVKTNP